MNIPFSRDILKQRPIPQKKKDIIINFENKEQEKTEKEEENTEKEVKIIDKRNEYELNRSEIMERMKQKKAFVVPISREIQSRKPIMPIEFKKPKETEIKKIENPVFENKNKYNKIMDDFENKLYNCIEGKKEKIGKNSDWYEEMESIDVKKFLREKHNIDDELMKKYIIYHFLDTQNIDTKITLLKVIYEAENMKINVGGEGGEEEEFTHDQEEAIEKNVMINMAAEDERMKEKNKNLLLIEKHMKNYFDKKELRLDALNFCYSFYNIEKNINDFYVYRDNEFQLLNSAVDNLKYQQLELKNAIDKKSMHNVVGFMSPFKNEGNVFKVKDIYSQYNNKGSYCKNLSKDDTIKKLNCLLNSFKCQFKVDDHEDEKDKPDFKSSYTPDEIKDKMRKTGLAIIAEFLFRYYDEKRERGLRYFFDAEESHISQISMLRPI